MRYAKGERDEIRQKCGRGRGYWRHCAGDAGTGAAIGATVGTVRGRRRQKKAQKTAQQQTTQQIAQAQQQSQAQAQAQQLQALDTFRRGVHGRARIFRQVAKFSGRRDRPELCRSPTSVPGNARRRQSSEIEAHPAERCRTSHTLQRLGTYAPPLVCRSSFVHSRTHW